MPPPDGEQLLNNSFSLNFEARLASFNFDTMKRALAGLFLISLLTTSSAVLAADAVTLAAQQEAEERYKRLAATVEELQTAQAAQQKQISALANEVSRLREEIAHNNNNAATQESIRELNKQILKVDESRIADNKRIQEALERLAKTITEMPAPPTGSKRLSASDSGANAGNSGRPAARPPANASNAPEDGFWYTVQNGDYHLGVIVKRYNDEKIPVTARAVMNANPNVDWTRLKIGQKIFIPKPK